MSEWQSTATPPEHQDWVLGWLHLPKNPQASGPMLVQRVFEEIGERIPLSEVVPGDGTEPAAWWSASGSYYPASYVTHWMALPAPPSEEVAPQQISQSGAVSGAEGATGNPATPQPIEK